MSEYKEGTYNYNTKTGYSTPEWEITDISEDLSDYIFTMEFYDRNYASVKVLKYTVGLQFKDGSIKIPSIIEKDRDGIYCYNIILEKDGEKHILLSGLKIVENEY